MVHSTHSLEIQIRSLIHIATPANTFQITSDLIQLLSELGYDSYSVFLCVCFQNFEVLQSGQLIPSNGVALVSSVFEVIISLPHFPTALLSSVSSSQKSPQYILQFFNALHLSVPTVLVLGLALSEFQEESFSNEGCAILLKIVEGVEGISSAAVSADLLSALLLKFNQINRADLVVNLQRLLVLHSSSGVEAGILAPFCKESTRTYLTERSNTDPTKLRKTMALKLNEQAHLADLMQELGYGCTSDLQRCIDFMSQLKENYEEEICRIICMVARTYSGLNDQPKQGSGGASLTSSNLESGWNVKVLMEALFWKVPNLNLTSVAQHLDHDKFFLPDQKSFSLLLDMFSKFGEIPAPIPSTLVCGSVWKNKVGQLSFIQHASVAPPEVFSFADSPRTQPPLEGLHGQKSSIGSPNQAWLSLDLLEVLCKLAEAGHAAEVHSILEYPLKNCPEILLTGLAQVKTEWNVVQSELFSYLLPVYVFNNPNSSTVLHRVWPSNSEAVLKAMLDVHGKDPSQIPRILEVCQDLKILTTVLECTPFMFAIDLASLASRREYLNLEKWLQDAINTHHDKMIQACVAYLKERLLPEPSRADQTPAIVPLAPEITAVFLKILQQNVGNILVPELAEEVKRLIGAAVLANPRLQGVVATEPATGEVFANDVEEEANSYFQKIYTGQLEIGAMVETLRRFSSSQVQREQEVFACMIQSLFDEYRFFSRYPDKELTITAILFGSLISHQLVSSGTLGIALRCVLEALRKPADTKMFQFGIKALEQFKERLIEWPQYCNHILQTPQLREVHPQLVDYVELSLKRGQSEHSNVPQGVQEISQAMSQTNIGQNNPQEVSVGVSEAGTNGEELPGSENVAPELQDKAPAIAEQLQSQSQSGAATAPSNLKQEISTGSLPAALPTQADTSQGSQSQDSQSLPAAKQEMLRSLRETPPGRPASSPGFGHTLNIETLVAAAEKREGPIKVPTSEFQDKMAFIINNLSTSNVESKAKEMQEILEEDIFPWFAQYMVMKRSSIEPNFHELYLKFLDKIGNKGLMKEIHKATYENCKVLLRSELIKSSSGERSLLKNLGSWLGKLTIGRNQALRARDIDPKSLIMEAYEKGLMIAVVPFVRMILEPCSTSLAYQPPNPWTMGILSLLKEIYSLSNLKMNLKFDIEVLFKNLTMDMKDVKPSQLLIGRERVIEGNPDFSNKDLHAAKQLSVSSQASEASATSTTAVQAEQVQMSDVEEKNPSATAQAGGPSAAASLASGQSFLGSMTIPNLAAYIVFSPNLGILTQQFQLQRIVPAAMERAIREIISPVVERSNTIACMTTRELVMKDLAMEADENRILKASSQTVASLAGSLAHVTCKEPLKTAILNHLRTLIHATGNTGADVEPAVQIVTNDNLDLGCAVIEKAATEKALRDIEEVMSHPLSLRRKQRESLGPAFYDASIYSQGSLARLPETLRPKPGRLSPAQQRVYEDFTRHSGQSQSAPRTQTPPPATAPTSSTSIATPPPPPPPPPSLPPVALTPPRALTSQARPPFSPLQSGAVQSAVGGSTVVSSGEASMPAVTSVEASEGNAASSVSLGKAAVEQLGDHSLSAGDAVEKIHLIFQKLDAAVQSQPSNLSYSDLPSDHEIKGFMAEIQKVFTLCVSRDEAAIAVAQKLLKRLYESPPESFQFSTNLTALLASRDACPRLPRELTNWVVQLDEERQLNRGVVVALVQSGLVSLPEYSLHLVQLMDGGRNAVATEFALQLLKACVHSNAAPLSDFYPVLEVFAKLASNPGAPESMVQIVELAKITAASPSPTAGASIVISSTDNKVSSKEGSPVDLSPESPPPPPPGMTEQVVAVFEEWARICETQSGNEKVLAVFLSQIQQTGLMKNEENAEHFFRILTELAVAHCLASEGKQAGKPSGSLLFAAVDAYAKLVVLLVKYYVDPSNPSLSKINLFHKVLVITIRLIHAEADKKKTGFNAKPYFRMFVSWLSDLSALDPLLDPSNFQVLTALATTFQALQPLRVPAFSFVWLELVSHRTFMPKLLLVTPQQQHKGWPLFQRLLTALFKFMEPYLRNAELADPVRLLYKGTLRVLLVLLHDFPEFLCDHHFTFCDAIPPSCIQMRNLILSAFPRNMRLPDPFTPNLKVDLLPEISQPPRILSDVEASLRNSQLKTLLDEYLQTRQPTSFLTSDLKQRLVLSPLEASQCGTKYNVPLVNAIVLYVGMQAIQQLQRKSTPQQLAVPSAPITHSAPMDVFQSLVSEMDAEGRYLFLNALANQLRYPNNHTHYFSCVLLYLFAEAQQEAVQEQITRVLLERLIVNRPHPWGLLITFIELIKNPRYNFWSHGFTRCAPEIEKLFESVARSCMGPPPKLDDDLQSGMQADQLKLQ